MVHIMLLKEYLFRAKITVAQFARDMNISRTHADRLVNQKYRPSPELAKRIEEATDGKVTRHELLYPNEAKSPFFKESE